jgi:hypothetical protein
MQRHRSAALQIALAAIDVLSRVNQWIEGYCTGIRGTPKEKTQLSSRASDTATIPNHR